MNVQNNRTNLIEKNYCQSRLIIIIYIKKSRTYIFFPFFVRYYFISTDILSTQ